MKNNPPSSYEKLLDDAPLWIDWQIDKAIENRDIKKPEQAQAATEEIVKLLGRLPNPNLRASYIQKCSELLGQGNIGFVRQIEDNLRLQVKGQRWHGQSKKWQTPGDRTLVDTCEEQLLRIYLHAPQHRDLVLDALDQHDLSFTQRQHYELWQLVLDIQKQYPTHLEFESAEAPDLLSILRDRSAEFPPELAQVCRFLELDEKTSVDIERAALVIRSATANLERVICVKRRRHWLDLWKSTDIIADPDIGQDYQQHIKVEDRRMLELDRLRQTQFNDLIETPLF